MVVYDLRRLRVLRELQLRGTLGAVATALGYTPSAISQQLAVLEKEAGVRLLDKAGRGVRLTDAATVLCRHAAAMLAAAEAAEAELASMAEQVGGTVRAGGLSSATQRVLVPTLAAVRRDHPSIRVEISEIELEQALPELRLGNLDLVISDDYDGHPRPRPAGLRFTQLLQEQLMLVLPADHPLARHEAPVPVASLRDDIWITSPSGSGHDALVVSTCRALGGFEPDIRHRSNDADVQLDLVRAAHAVAFLPELTLPTNDPTIAIRDIADATINRRLMILTRDTPPTPALQRFLDSMSRLPVARHAHAS